MAIDKLKGAVGNIGGELRNSFARTLFDEESYKKSYGDTDLEGKTKNGYAVIRITPTSIRKFSTSMDIPITGVISEKLNFSINAEWGARGGFGGLIPSIKLLDGIKSKGVAFVNFANKVAPQFGVGEIGEVYASKKLYKKSGYLEINPKIRIVNWTSNWNTILIPMMLLSMCVPGEAFDVIKATAAELRMNGAPDQALALLAVANDVKKEISKGALNAAAAVGYASKQPEDAGKEEKFFREGGLVKQSKKTVTEKGIDAVTGIATLGVAVGKFLGNAGADNVLDDISDYWTLRGSPSPVKVEISNYFSHSDMVLENVILDFSREMTRSGPLWVDATLKLSSRKIISSANDIGLFLPRDGASRVITIDKQNEASRKGGLTTF